MDSDSTLDLDDVAAGHPVAMYELKELRAQRDAAHNDARLLDGQIAEMRGALEAALPRVREIIHVGWTKTGGRSNAKRTEKALELACALENILARALLPAPGVAQEPEGKPFRCTIHGAGYSCQEPEKPPEGKPSEREEDPVAKCLACIDALPFVEDFPKMHKHPEGGWTPCAKTDLGRYYYGQRWKPSPSPERK